MSGYNALVAGAGYLRDVELRLSAANGITRRDLRAAEALARNTIDRALKPVYDTSLWVEETPGIVERIADMLSSAFILREKRRRGNIAPDEDAHLPAVLEREARALLGMVAKDTVPVIDTGGRRQARLAAPRSGSPSGDKGGRNELRPYRCPVMRPSGTAGKVGVAV